MGYDAATISRFRGILCDLRKQEEAWLRNNGSDSPLPMEEPRSIKQDEQCQVVEMIQRHDQELSNHQDRLREIERAIRECDQGTYGTCRGCGQLILLERLEIMPIASRCVPCCAKNAAQKNHRARQPALIRR